jgi:hypothetical protein
MPQPLGLSSAGFAAYVARINGSHDFRMTVDVLDTAENVVGQAVLIDGQVNLQRNQQIHRTGSLTLSDPDHALNLDGDSVWEGAVFGNRMVRVTHTVTVPGFGDVSACVGVFKIASLQRDGIEVQVELQDKTAWAVRGTKPFGVKKGANAVEAFRYVLAHGTGETKFRLPAGSKVRLDQALSIGWSDDASPAVACDYIAALLGMDWDYSSDGFATLRQTSTTPVWTFDTDVNVTALPTGANDWADAVNYVRVNGGKKGAKPGTATLTNHPNAPGRLGRNGVDLYLPLIDDKTFKTYAQRNKRASKVLAKHRDMNVDMAWPVVPVFHLDAGDRVRLVTPDGSTTVPLNEASIPLGVGGDMTVGAIKAVSYA